MSSVENLKERARSFEQNEQWGEALDLYSQAIDLLSNEDTPDIALFNRSGDLATKIGSAAQAALAAGADDPEYRGQRADAVGDIVGAVGEGHGAGGEQHHRRENALDPGDGGGAVVALGQAHAGAARVDLREPRAEQLRDRADRELQALLAGKGDLFAVRAVVPVIKRRLRQRSIAQELRAISSPGETIATHDSGAMGYFSERDVIDLVGLVNQDVVDFHEGRRLRVYVDDVRPDYIVVFDSWSPLLRLELENAPETFEELFISQPGREGPFRIYRTHY